MSETIILIMTSSSTRNTEPRGGRVAVMSSVLAHSDRKVRKIRQWAQRLCGPCDTAVERDSPASTSVASAGSSGERGYKNVPQVVVRYCFKLVMPGDSRVAPGETTMSTRQAPPEK